MLQVPVELSCRQGWLLYCCIVKITNIDPLTDIDREKGFVWRYVIPPAVFIKQVLAAVDEHHPQVAGATHGNIGRTALQRDGFPRLRARPFREDQQGVALAQPLLTGA